MSFLEEELYELEDLEPTLLLPFLLGISHLVNVRVCFCGFDVGGPVDDDLDVS